MAMKFTTGFAVEAAEAIDTRIQLTKAEMAGVDLDAFPDVYFCFCPDDNSFYRFDYNDAYYDEPEKCFTKLEMGGGNVSEVTVGPSEPSNSQPGDRWLDTSSTPYVEKVYNGSEWEVVPPNKGDMIFDEVTGQLMVFDGTNWKYIGGVPLHNPDGSIITKHITFYAGTEDPNALADFGAEGDVYFRQV